MQDQTRNSKKPYLKPQFSIYGSATTLTLASNTAGTVSDNNGGGQVQFKTA